MATSYRLPQGYTLTVTPDSDGPAHARMVEQPSIAGMVYSATVFGPYQFDATFLVHAGTVAIAADTTVIPHLLLDGAGAPEDAVRAAVNVNPTGDDNGLTFTAVEYGAVGNAIRVTYLDPSANDATLSVTVAGSSIIVSLKTGVAGAIESTAAEILAAVSASTAAARLVTPTIYAGDSGVADDGSGVVTAMTATALTGGAGTGIGRSKPGGLYIDTENAFVYRNSGTQAAPVWTKLGDAA